MKAQYFVRNCLYRTTGNVNFHHPITTNKISEKVKNELAHSPLAAI